MSIYLANFNSPKDLSDAKYFFDNFGKTNIDFLLYDFDVGSTNWSIPKKAVPGDIVAFMCANTARNNFGMAVSHYPASWGLGFQQFVDQQKALYKKYSGFLLGYGIVASVPVFDAESNWWFAEINQLTRFDNPIPYGDYKSFIKLNSMGSITVLKDAQWDRLKWLVNQKNPMLFPGAPAPDIEALDQEFHDAVQQQEKKSLAQLKKEAAKKASSPTVSVVITKTYHRDATIAAYVKKRANGQCQLCKQPAPFLDQNGEPYLECHHIEWLSKGGMDSVDNCVALCPNCHTRMHILDSPQDVLVLKASIKQ